MSLTPGMTSSADATEAVVKSVADAVATVRVPKE